MKYPIGLLPSCELFCDNIKQLPENREEPIVGTQPARELPDSFHVVQLRAVRGEEIEPEEVPMIPQPGLYIARLVISGIIQNDDQSPVAPAMAKELLEEEEERGGIEPLLRHRNQPAIGGTDRPHDPYAFASGSEEDDGINVLRRYPHE